MKRTIEIDGLILDSVSGICERFAVSAMTFYRWKRHWGFVPAHTIGKKHFYDRKVLDARIAECTKAK